jgi:hypothetical protein
VVLSVEQAVESIAGGLAEEFADLEPSSGAQRGRIAAAVQAAYRGAAEPGG